MWLQLRQILTISIIFALPKQEKMYKTGHAFSYLLVKESIANEIINVSRFAGPVCCEPRHRQVEASSVDTKGGNFEHYLWLLLSK